MQGWNGPLHASRVQRRIAAGPDMSMAQFQTLARRKAAASVVMAFPPRGCSRFRRWRAAHTLIASMCIVWERATARQAHLWAAC